MPPPPPPATTNRITSSDINLVWWAGTKLWKRWTDRIYVILRGKCKASLLCHIAILVPIEKLNYAWYYTLQRQAKQIFLIKSQRFYKKIWFLDLIYWKIFVELWECDIFHNVISYIPSSMFRKNNVDLFFFNKNEFLSCVLSKCLISLF